MYTFRITTEDVAYLRVKIRKRTSLETLCNRNLLNAALVQLISPVCFHLSFFRRNFTFTALFVDYSPGVV